MLAPGPQAEAGSKKVVVGGDAGRGNDRGYNPDEWEKDRDGYWVRKDATAKTPPTRAAAEGSRGGYGYARQAEAKAAPAPKPKAAGRGKEATKPYWMTNMPPPQQPTTPPVASPPVNASTFTVHDAQPAPARTPPTAAGRNGWGQEAAGRGWSSPEAEKDKTGWGQPARGALQAAATPALPKALPPRTDGIRNEDRQPRDDHRDNRNDYRNERRYDDHDDRDNRNYRNEDWPHKNEHDDTRARMSKEERDSIVRQLNDKGTRRQERAERVEADRYQYSDDFIGYKPRSRSYSPQKSPNRRPARRPHESPRGRRRESPRNRDRRPGAFTPSSSDSSYYSPGDRNPAPPLPPPRTTPPRDRDSSSSPPPGFRVAEPQRMNKNRLFEAAMTGARDEKKKIPEHQYDKGYTRPRDTIEISSDGSSLVEPPRNDRDLDSSFDSGSFESPLRDPRNAPLPDDSFDSTASNSVEKELTKTIEMKREPGQDWGLHLEVVEYGDKPQWGWKIKNIERQSPADVPNLYIGDIIDRRSRGVLAQSDHVQIDVVTEVRLSELDLDNATSRPKKCYITDFDLSAASPAECKAHFDGDVFRTAAYGFFTSNPIFCQTFI